MSYATLQDAIDLYGETYVLTSVDRDEDGASDTTAITDALTQASSFIDSYLGARYDVPIPAPVPALLVKYEVDIAIYQLSADAGTGTDEKRRRYEDAEKWLINVAKGVASLGLDDPTDEQEHLPQTSYPNARLFTRSKMGLL